MNSKERVIKALDFEIPDRVPFNFWMDRRLMKKYEEKYGPDFRVNHFGADVIETFPALEWPRGKGEMRDGSFWVQKPLLKTWDHVSSLSLPDPSDENVYESIRETLEKYPEKAIFVNIIGPFTILHNIRLLDNLYLDVYDHSKKLHQLISEIMEIQNQVISRVVELPITAIYFQDDIATSNGLMFSLPMIKEFILDYFKTGIKIAKKADKKIIFHSDGDVTQVLDTLVDYGFDAVNPLQPEINDLENFNKCYQGKIATYGGLDNTKIIPNGSKKEVEEHVENIFELLGKNSGLIFSSHDIPLHCPQENVEVMVETIKKCKY